MDIAQHLLVPWLSPTAGGPERGRRCRRCDWWWPPGRPASGAVPSTRRGKDSILSQANAIRKVNKKAQTNQINKEYAKVFSYINLILILMYSAINYQL